ncbi:MAG: restriction endonuclease subunit S [Alistipes sp.]|nr:restriction endonuclease subunit S [Alistipes sp.]
MSREMVNSGIPWIGEIPRKWRLSRYKFFATSRMGETILSEDTKECGIPVYSATQDGKIFGYVETSKVLLHKGDFVIPARGNSIGCISVVKEEVATCTQTTICSYNIRNINSSFLYYCGWGLKDEWFKFDGSAIPQITVSQVNNNLLPLPSIEEQQKIASFLDRKCCEIDEMIALQEKIVEELKAYKQSVITEAVTKGLNPDVPMRDSGIEWIGEIPEHWRVTTIGRLFRVSAGGDAKWDIYSDKQDNEHPFPVYTNTLDKNQTYAYTSIPVYKGDTITVTGRGDIGRAFYRKTPFDAIIRLLVLEKRYSLDCRYFAYFINNVIHFFTNSAAIGQLSAVQVVPYNVCHPSIEEQTDIADYLDTKCAEIDNLISLKLSKIDSLKEYKKSIIYEYVTGKKEVI